MTGPVLPLIVDLCDRPRTNDGSLLGQGGPPGARRRAYGHPDRRVRPDPFCVVVQLAALGQPTTRDRCRLCTRHPDWSAQPPRTQIARLCSGDLCSFRSHQVGGNRGVGMGQRPCSTGRGWVIVPAVVIGQLARSDFETPQATVANRRPAKPRQNDNVSLLSAFYGC